MHHLMPCSQKIEEQLRRARLLISELKNDSVSDWYDIDDFMHRGFTSKIVCDIGELCAHLAYIFPGEISGMYSRKALPYLDEISEAMKIGESDLRETLSSIRKRLPLTPSP